MRSTRRGHERSKNTETPHAVNVSVKLIVQVAAHSRFRAASLGRLLVRSRHRLCRPSGVSEMLNTDVSCSDSTSVFHGRRGKATDQASTNVASSSSTTRSRPVASSCAFRTSLNATTSVWVGRSCSASEQPCLASATEVAQLHVLPSQDLTPQPRGAPPRDGVWDQREAAWIGSDGVPLKHSKREWTCAVDVSLL